MGFVIQIRLSWCLFQVSVTVTRNEMVSHRFFFSSFLELKKKKKKEEKTQSARHTLSDAVYSPVSTNSTGTL